MIMEDIQQLINEKQGEILEMKAFLNATDYVVLKLSEGYQIDENMLSKRAEARSEINRLEKEVKVLVEEKLNCSEIPNDSTEQ